MATAASRVAQLARPCTASTPRLWYLRGRSDRDDRARRAENPRRRSRGDAAAATRIFREDGDAAAATLIFRGDGDAAAVTLIFRGDGGCDEAMPWRRVAAAVSGRGGAATRTKQLDGIVTLKQLYGTVTLGSHAGRQRDREELVEAGGHLPSKILRDARGRARGAHRGGRHQVARGRRVVLFAAAFSRLVVRGRRRAERRCYIFARGGQPRLAVERRGDAG